MVEQRAPREGLGLMSVGGAVFVVAALVAAVVSPLAGGLTRTIRDVSSPIAQAAPAGEHAVRAQPAVKVLSLPPMLAIAGPESGAADEADTERGRAHRGLGRGQALTARQPLRVSLPAAPLPAPAPAVLASPLPAPAPAVLASPADHVPPAEGPHPAPTKGPERKAAPGRGGEASPDRITAAGSEPRAGKDKPRKVSENKGGGDATMKAAAAAESHPSRGSKRRRR